jgi:hypothetical protein
MKRARKLVVTVLVTFLLGCIVFAGVAIHADRRNAASCDGEAYSAVMETLLGIAGIEVDDKDADVLAGRRLSQKLTVTTDDGAVVSGGTVTKIQDDFYPGSYKITFSKKAILTSRAVVEVQMDVKKGDDVYILIGDKDSGYTEYACVTAKEDNLVSFDTNILQDYTLSKTDIKSAQEAMADILSTGSGSSENSEN